MARLSLHGCLRAAVISFVKMHPCIPEIAEELLSTVLISPYAVFCGFDLLTSSKLVLEAFCIEAVHACKFVYMM